MAASVTTALKLDDSDVKKKLKDVEKAYQDTYADMISETKKLSKAESLVIENDRKQNTARKKLSIAMANGDKESIVIMLK